MSQQKRTVSALFSDNSDNEEIITIHTSCKSKAVSRILNEESEGSTSVTHSHSRRIVRYDCSKCNDNFVQKYFMRLKKIQ